MPDREKVIKGLEYCAASCKGAWEDNNGCPYMSEFCKKCLNDNEYNGRCIDLLCADALALLKAQEPVKPVISTGESDDPWGRLFFCGACGKRINEKYNPDEYDKYCKHCGQAVKWE